MYQGLWLNNKSTMRKKKKTFNGRVNSIKKKTNKGYRKMIAIDREDYLKKKKIRKENKQE